MATFIEIKIHDSSEKVIINASQILHIARSKNGCTLFCHSEADGEFQYRAVDDYEYFVRWLVSK